MNPASTSWLLIAASAGIFAALQSGIAGSLQKKIGMSSTLTINTLVFTLLALIFLAVEAFRGNVPWNKMREITPLETLGGACGFFLVLCLALSFPRLGALYSLVLMILGQCVAAIIIDKFGFFGLPAQSISLYRVAAVAMILGGVFLLNK